MTNTATKATPAADVRAYFAERPDALPEGVTIGQRGRLHPDVVAVFNQRHPKRSYILGAKAERTIPVKVTLQNKKGQDYTKTVNVPVSEVRAEAGTARGRLPKAAAEAVALRHIG